MFSFFLSKNRNLIVFIFLFILSSSFMSFSSSKFSVTFKEVGETIIYPFRYVVIQIGDGISSFFSAFSDDDGVEEQLEAKTKEIKYYQQKLLKLAVLKDENKRLRELLKYKEASKYTVEAARILSRDPENNFSSLTLDKGTMDGVKRGMPVFAFMNGEQGVVGVVSESSLFSSKVKTFRNREFAIGVYLPHSQVHGVIQGIGDNKNVMSLLYIDKEISLNLREPVVTSSESQVFPPGVYVGNISYIDTTDKTRLTYQAYLKPFIHLSKIKDVFVIINSTKKTGKQQ